MVRLSKSLTFSRLAWTWFLAVAFCMCSVGVQAQTVTESFRNSTATGWNLGTDSGTFSPLLTASNGTDTAGNGWLQLTQNQNAEATYAVSNQSFTATGATVYAKFTYTSWGGSGADGLTFFLYDPTVMGSTFTPGAYGGSLGYAQKNANLGADTTHGGMAGGYLAVGLDEYGNFSNPTEGRVGGPGQTGQAIAVRGAYDPTSYQTINGVSGYFGGYNYLGGTSSLTPGISIPNASTRPDQTGADFRQVIVSLTPQNLLSVYLQQGATSSPTLMLSLNLSSYTRPNQLAFGFSAGTGGLNNNHEIRDLTISTSVANYWTGLGGNTSWGTTTNWNSLPPTYADIRFDNSVVSGAQTIDLGSTSPTIRSLTIDSPYNYTVNSTGGGQIQFNSNGSGTSQLLVSNVNGNATAHTINAGISLANALEVQNGSTAQLNLTGALSTNGNAVTFDGAGSTTESGVVSGAGSVTKSDTGTLALTGANTYTGGTTLNGGTLSVGNNTALGTGTVTLNGGTLTSSASNTVGNILTLQGNATFSNITTSGTLTQNGADRTLNMANATQSGTVNLSESTGTGRTLTVNVNPGYNATISGVIENAASAGAAGNLNMTGQGTLTLSGANTYTGTTTVNAGTLQLGASDRLADTSSLNIAGGTFSLNGFSEKIGNLSWSNNGTLDFGTTGTTNNFVFGTIASQSGTLVVNNFENGIDTLASTVSGQTVSSIYISGYGNATESGTTTTVGSYGLAYKITPIVQAGSIWKSTSSNVWRTRGNWSTNSVPNSTSALAIFDGTGTYATPDLGGNRTLNGLRFDTNATPYTINGSGRTLTMSSTPSGIAAYIQQKSANVQTLNFSTLQLNRNTVFDVTGSGNLVVNSDITGSTNLIKDGTGAGRLILTSTNWNFTGGIYVNNGILQLSNSNTSGVFGSTTGMNVSTGATLELANNVSVYDAINVAGTGYLGNGGIHAISGNDSIYSNITLTSSPTSFVADTGTSLYVDTASTVSLGGNSLMIDGAGNTTIAGTITGTGAVIASSTGTVTLSGNNTYTGGAAANSGTLAITAANALGTGVASVQSGATLSLTASGMTINNTMSLAGTGVAGNGAIENTTGANTITGAINLFANSRIQTDSGATTNINGGITFGYNTLTIGGVGTTNIGGGLVSTTGSQLAKSDSGTLAFTSAFNFNGTITLNGGVLDLSKAGGSSITSIVMNGGTLLLGNGSFNITNLTVNTTGSIIDFGTGTTSGTLNATNLTLGGSLGVNGLSVNNWVNLVDTFYASNVNGQSSPTITRGSSPLDDIAFNPPTYSGSNTAWISWDGTNKFLTPVPEPSTYGAIFSGLSLLSWFFIRRRRRPV